MGNCINSPIKITLVGDNEQGFHRLIKDGGFLILSSTDFHNLILSHDGFYDKFIHKKGYHVTIKTKESGSIFQFVLMDCSYSVVVNIYFEGENINDVPADVQECIRAFNLKDVKSSGNFVCCELTTEFSYNKQF